MGIETEYGISVPGHPNANAMMSSSQIVNAYGQFALQGARVKAHWDYDVESPLRDARGFDMSRADADPSQLTDDDAGMANVILTNGARLYVDHAHPEYSSPEVTKPRDAVLWDRAGTHIMLKAMELAAAVPQALPILLYKNNTDNKGASYGCHENYLMRRATPFADIVRHLTPFFITRQVFTGAGRLGVGQDGRRAAFQMSQRADFFEVEVGLETTLKRPIINTRDEPHADPERYRRLHVIVGDANLSDTATYLKLGTTAIVLSMIEEGFLRGLDLWPAHPVAEMHAVSHDVSLTHALTMSQGRGRTALDVQREILDKAVDFCSREVHAPYDDDTRHLLVEWQRVLDGLSTDPDSLATEIDWLAKRALMDGFVRRDGLDWDSPRLALIDLQYADIRPERGLAARLEARGMLRRMFTDAEVARAVTDPPVDTRAYFRGECIRRYPDAVAAASWDSVVFDVPGSDSLMRVPTLEPLRGTRAHVQGLLDSAPDVTTLIARLSASASR
ncbi:MAG: proteasome accessory factor PafA2 [Actinobacteria bacterium]|nr:proteasome accessory factor PafA2 [Actinomycetota bacterium]